MSNKLSVLINGVRYAITSSEDVPYVQELAHEIDELVTDLMRHSSMSIDQAMMLAALHFLDLYKKADESADHLRAQITAYAEDSAKMRTELTEARRELSGRQGGKHNHNHNRG
jgi:cell division protein ZapA